MAGFRCSVCRQPALTEHHLGYNPEKMILVCEDCHDRIHHGDLWRLDPTKDGNCASSSHEKLRTESIDAILTNYGDG